MNQSLAGQGPEPTSGLALPSPAELAQQRRQVMTQKKMAERIGADPAQLSRFEQGKGGMSYERIRRYAHVLATKRAASEPHRFLVERIAHRGPLVELSMDSRIDQAMEGMVTYGVGQLPVKDREGDPIGVLTDAAVCEALVDENPTQAMARPVGALPIEPLDVVRPGDPLQKVAALLASHWLVRVDGENNETLGFATRRDLLPMLLGQSTGPSNPGEGFG